MHDTLKMELSPELLRESTVKAFRYTYVCNGVVVVVEIVEEVSVKEYRMRDEERRVIEREIEKER